MVFCWLKGSCKRHSSKPEKKWSVIQTKILRVIPLKNHVAYKAKRGSQGPPRATKPPGPHCAARASRLLQRAASGLPTTWHPPRRTPAGLPMRRANGSSAPSWSGCAGGRKANTPVFPPAGASLGSCWEQGWASPCRGPAQRERTLGGPLGGPPRGGELHRARRPATSLRRGGPPGGEIPPQPKKVQFFSFIPICICCILSISFLS